jgi:hypothetical protein
VFLLVERAVVSLDDAMERAKEKPADRKETAEDRLKLPATLEIRLPKGWKDTAGATGECRVSVLVASREPHAEYAPNGMRQQVRELVRSQKVIRDLLERKTKDGDWILKTEWLALKNPGVRK